MLGIEEQQDESSNTLNLNLNIIGRKKEEESLGVLHHEVKV